MPLLIFNHRGEIAEARIHQDHSKSEVRDMLHKIAETQGYRSINQLLEVWVRVYPTGINGEIRRRETSLKSISFPKRQFKSFGAAAGI